VKTLFGDLPDEGKELLIKHLRIDYSKCTFKGPRWFSTYVVHRGKIVGIFATDFPFWFEGRINVLVLDPRCVTRRLLVANYTALFSQARRLTAEVEPTNRRALREVQEMGFVYEGFKRLGLEGTRDVMQFGMLKSECVYLPDYRVSTVMPLPTMHAPHERLQ
jgi:hypothetical protein